ncbi:MAG: FAD-binding protein, partial [Nitrospirae bacterium]|nr:FAD-binding protein [Nitrospirota bacterium]
RVDLDISKQAILVYPTLHYQNGGIRIDETGETSVPNLFAAGEAAGGIHGRNRLMGNSLLDVVVFGRRAGAAAARRSRETEHGRLTLDHVVRHRAALKEAGIEEPIVGPILVPTYARQRAG